MASTTTCFAPFQAQAIRATRLDGCGAPVVGPKSTLVSDGVISVEMKGQIDTGTDVEVKNAKGELKVSDPACPQFKWYDVTITMTDVDPDLFEMTTSQQLITATAGAAIGFRISEGAPCNSGIALETWTKVGTDDGDCGADGPLFGYFLLPQIVNGMLGDITLNDGAMSCVLTGRTKRGSKWGVGPATYLVAGTSAVPAAISPTIGPKDHLHVQVTPVPPPEAACGAIALPPAE